MFEGARSGVGFQFLMFLFVGRVFDVAWQCIG